MHAWDARLSIRSAMLDALMLVIDYALVCSPVCVRVCVRAGDGLFFSFTLSYYVAQQVASLTEAGSFLANLLIFRIQVCLLIGCVAVHGCVVCIVVGVALQRCSESNWDRTQLSLAIEDSTPLLPSPRCSSGAANAGPGGGLAKGLAGSDQGHQLCQLYSPALPLWKQRL